MLQQHIHILDFIKNGTFGGILVGDTKKEIINKISIPDDYAGKSLEKAKIWRYGNIEFHFYEQKLHFIFSDYLEKLEGGSKFVLDRWIFDKQQVSLQNVMDSLEKEGVNYSKSLNVLNQIELKILESKVKLIFVAENAHFIAQIIIKE
jgi:hypothetical protein